MAETRIIEHEDGDGGTTGLYDGPDSAKWGACHIGSVFASAGGGWHVNIYRNLLTRDDALKVLDFVASLCERREEAT